MTERVVGTVAELPEGSRRSVDVDGLEIGVFNVRSRYCALPNHSHGRRRFLSRVGHVNETRPR